jgi:hypothetical protein
MNKLLKGSIRALMIFALAVGTVQAATYDFVITGDVILGDEFGDPNDWNLTGGDIILASGTFTAELGSAGNETGTVSFGSGSGNTLSIDMFDGSFITASDDNSYAGGGFPELVFASGDLDKFNLVSDSLGFNSSFLGFDDWNYGGYLYGEWGSLTLTEVPVPAAAWLFGSALLGLAGIKRRK